MLRTVVLDQGESGESILPLVEFAYNNSYEATIDMVPHEELYRKKFRSPLYRNERDERKRLQSDKVNEMIEIVLQKKIKDA